MKRRMRPVGVNTIAQVRRDARRLAPSAAASHDRVQRPTSRVSEGSSYIAYPALVGRTLDDNLGSTDDARRLFKRFALIDELMRRRVVDEIRDGDFNGRIVARIGARLAEGAMAKEREEERECYYRCVSHRLLTNSDCYSLCTQIYSVGGRACIQHTLCYVIITVSISYIGDRMNSVISV